MTSGSSDDAAVEARGPSELERRLSLAELFFGFSEIALSGFGGVLPWARLVIVERRQWLSSEEFTALLGFCQFLPGPNVVNLSVVIGARHHGAVGALVASLGMLAAPFVIVVCLGALYSHFGSVPAVQAALRGMSAVAAGLIIAMGLRMAADLRSRPVGMALAALTFGAIAILRLPLPILMLGLAPIGVALAWKGKR